MRYLTLAELLELHHRIIDQSGGADGIRDLGLAESALAQPQMSFGGVDLSDTRRKSGGAVFLVGDDSFVVKSRSLAPIPAGDANRSAQRHDARKPQAAD